MTQLFIRVFERSSFQNDEELHLFYCDSLVAKLFKILIYAIRGLVTSHVTCYLLPILLVPRGTWGLYNGLQLFSVHCNHPRFLPWSLPCLFTFPFNCSSPCCLWPSLYPFPFQGPPYCNVRINMTILPLDVTNHIPSTILHFLTQQFQTHSFQQLFSTDVILPSYL